MDAHLGMMQVWAWATMLSDRIPEQGIEQALDTTFSGDHPCEKCNVIAEFKEKEAEEESSSPERRSVDSEQVAKLIGVFSQVKPAYVCLADVKRVPFWAVEFMSPDDFILEVASPPPRVV